MIFGAGVVGFPPRVPVWMWVLFALCHTGAVPVCFQLVWREKKLVIRKIIGVFKAKAAVPSHSRLCTSALLRENLHRGPLSKPG